MAISYNRNEFSHKGKKFNQMQTKNALKAAVWYLQEHSYYAPIMERFPIRSDEELSKMDRDDLIQHETCACANENNVHIDTKLMVNLINEDIDLCSKKYGVSDNLMDCVQTIVAHEYNHILCQHHKIVGKIYDTYKGKVPKVVYYAHVYAAEIEANRGHCVNEDSAVYKCGVTDENYPEVKPLRYYSQLFEHFLRMGKEQQQKLSEMMKKFAKQLATSAKSSGNNELGEQIEKAFNIKSSGQGKGGDDTSEHGQEDGQKRTHGNGDRQGDEDSQEDGEWEELTEEQILKAINNATAATTSLAQGSEQGIGLESTECPYKPNLTPQERLDNEYARWDEKRVKKELGKMKGLIRGTISKNRESTYARPTRRAIDGSTSLIKKGVRYEKSYSPKVLIAMDSSGSMCSTTMKEVACAIENIFKDLGKPKVGSYICKHESQVSDVRPMKDWEVVVESYYPSGGNCFLHVVEEANKLGVDVVLNIGDGQDVVNRSGYYDNGPHLEPACRKFLANNRKWFDVLVTNKNENRYYEEEKEYDEKSGFHREGIYLGDKISKYFK